MNAGTRACLLGFLMLAGTYAVFAGRVVDSRCEIWRPAPVGAVRVGGVLGERIAATITNNLLKIDIEKDFIRPFQEKKGGDGAFVGTGNIIESLAYLAKQTGDEALRTRKERLVAAIIAAQEPDGYIGCMDRATRIWKAWDLEDIGFILDGLLADWTLFGNERALAAARRAADHVLAQDWKNPPRDWDRDIYDKELAMGLGHGVWSLYLATGDERYRTFVETLRGYGRCDEPIVCGRDRGIRGHTDGYLDTAFTQLEMFRTLGDRHLFSQTRRFYDHILDDGALITGGAGLCECWSGDQSDAGFCSETCMSAYALTVYDLSIRTGAADAALSGDLMERTLYNAFFAAQSRDGRRIRYYTPHRGARKWWPRDDYCCPCNYRRVIGYLPSCVFYQSDKGVLANLYAPATADLVVGGTGVHIVEETDYPTSGAVKLTIDPERDCQFAVSLRIPKGCGSASVQVNGERVDVRCKTGSLCVLDRIWRKGDVVKLDLGLEIRTVRGRARQTGRFAVMRGPLVYAVDTRPLEKLASGDKDIAKYLEDNGLDVTALPDLMTVDPENLRFVADDSVRPGGTAVEADAVLDPYAFGHVPEKVRRIRLTEFAGEENTLAYFRAPSPECVWREDPLFGQRNLGAFVRPPTPAWMSGRYGLMVHWLFPQGHDIDRWTEAFDVDAFLKDFAASGADWLIFPIGQCRDAWASPNAALERFAGPGFASQRDLVGEIAAGVHRLGRRFIAYAAVEQSGETVMNEKLGWDKDDPERRVFARRMTEIIREWSLRWGPHCDGWWLDGASFRYYPKGFDCRLWGDACRAGNPDSAVACNPGQDDFGVFLGSDFAAGEALFARMEDVWKIGSHTLFPIDGYWGGYWKWPTWSEEKNPSFRRRRPEMYDDASLAALQKKGEFPDPIYTQEELGRYVRAVLSNGAGATINVGINEMGRLNPKSLALVAALDRSPASSAKARGRLFMNEDAWHFWVSCTGNPDAMKTFDGTPMKPGIDGTRKGLEAYIDEIARGQVTHFLMNVNSQRANFDSKVFEPVWKSLEEPERAHQDWVRLLKRYNDEGLDPYKVWIGRCREKGVSPWISVRMNDLHGIGDVRSPMLSTMWLKHPEWHLSKDGPESRNVWQNGFDYTVKEVRDYHLAFVREVAERYDADGIELDLLRFHWYLPIGRERELAPVFTSFMRDVRAAVDEAAAKRGRKMQIAVRLNTTPDYSRQLGLEADIWAKEGLVDLIFVCNHWATIEFDIPLPEWRAWIGPDVEVIPGADSGMTEDGVRRLATIDEYRRFGREMSKRGARDFYLYNLFGHPQDGIVWNEVLEGGLTDGKSTGKIAGGLAK